MDTEERKRIMKTGLVLEGGAMRGMFTCGVLDVMMEQGISFDGAIGVSAGAVFGCNFKSRQIGRPLRYNKAYCADPRYGSFRSFLKTGDLFDAEFCYSDIPDRLDPFDAETYRENPMEFYVTCTDVETGKAVYHKCMKGDKKDIRWMRASASIPIVSRIVHIGDYKLLDGGIADSIPLRYFETLGYDRNVVILTQPLDYQKEKNKMIPLAKVLLRKYPEMIKAMEERHIGYNEITKHIREKELSGELFVIRPPMPLNISGTTKEPGELDRVYQIGRKTAEETLPGLKEYLGKENLSV